MRLTRLSLRDFRSYASEELELQTGLVAIVGPNGSGKTSLLEAAHLAVQGFSLRTRRDTAVIRMGRETARVDVQGLRGRGVVFAAMAMVDRQAGKRLELDGVPVPAAEQLRLELCALAFTPDRLAVVKGGPVIRRTYVDRMLGRLRPLQAEVPAEYGRALAQRNACLRRIRAGVSSPDVLAPWDAAVARAGSELDQAREHAVASLAPLFEDAGSSLGLPAPRLSYEPVPVSEDILCSRRSHDVERGATGAGPHLADLAIEAGGRDLRTFGSQGEQRLGVLALLLAEARLTATEREHPPLLLLDDVLSELDGERRAVLLSSLPPGSQTLVTATSLRAFPAQGPAPDQVIDVVPGKATAR
jgi:DNA replication and repair protein RecF